MGALRPVSGSTVAQREGVGGTKPPGRWSLYPSWVRTGSPRSCCPARFTGSGFTVSQG